MEQRLNCPTQSAILNGLKSRRRWTQTDTMGHLFLYAFVVKNTENPSNTCESSWKYVFHGVSNRVSTGHVHI